MGAPLKSGLDYRVRRSARARRVRITVHPDRSIEVVIPQRSPERDAAAAVDELRPWIERRLRALDQAVDELERTPGTVPFCGEELRLVPQPGRTRVHRRGDELLVPAATTGAGRAAAAGDAVAGLTDDGRAALERWYRAQARRVIAARLDAATARAGTTYTRLTIRAQRTRWASCSQTGAMSFNWRLLLAPPEVMDYVVEHEVCHLEVMDHSPRFWRLLESRVPDWREHQRWLRRYGSTLTL